MADSDHFITITEHAAQRALRRFWIPEDRLRQMAEKAVTAGYSIADAPNEKIARYLRRKARGKKVYVWSGYVFILTAEMRLVTTCRLPGHLLRTLPRVNTYIGGGHG